jgi:ABC-type transport system involved in multi-copper enzyme maturation permease subunit
MSVATEAPAARRPLGFGAGWVRTSAFAWGLQLRGARSLVLLILHLLPPLLAGLGALVSRLELVEVSIEGRALFEFMLAALYLPALLLLSTLFFGGSAVVEELENKTLTYLLTRPIPKPAIYLGRVSAGAALAAVLMSASVTASFAICAWGFGGHGPALGQGLRAAAVLLLGVAAYTSLFAWLSASFKHPLLLGLGFAFGWENLVGFAPFAIGKFTLSHHLRALLPAAEPARGGWQAVLARMLETPTTPSTAIGVLAIVTLAALAAGALAFSLREYRIEQ